MRAKLLQRLKESSVYLSGEELSKEFGVSRTAIWKCINQLREEGYEIESVTRKGYRLIQSADRITPEEILSIPGGTWVGQEIEYFEQTDSTNSRIRQFAEEGRKEGLLAVAEEQTGGRGRRGRAWVSPPGEGIWMSLLLRPQIEPYKASMITIVAALAMAKTVEEVTGLSADIKWPNDIVVNGKKVCGILTEMSAEIEEVHYVIVGVGINANIMEFPEDIQDVATSLALECGEKIERAKVIAIFCKHFECYYEKFLEKEDLSELKKDYEAHLINVGKQVKIIRKKEEIIRTAVGINEIGELLVKDPFGKIETIQSGEVSVRGLYGYV